MPTTSKPFFSKATVARYDNWAFKVFCFSTFFIIIFSVEAIHSWPSLVEKFSILLACILPASMIILARIPTWISEKNVPKEVLWALLVLTSGLAASFLSENRWSTVKSTILFVTSGPFIFIATLHLFKSRKNQKTFLWMTSVGILCFGFWGIYEHLFSGRIFLFSENPLPAGASLILLSTGPLVLLTQERSNDLRLTLILSLILAVILIILLAKKGPVLSLAVVLLFRICFMNRRRLKFLAGFALLAGCLLFISESTLLKYKNLSKFNNSVTLRAEHYLFGLHVFKENFVWGVGFKADLTRYLNDYSPKLFNTTSYRQYFTKFNTLENIVLTFLVELGGLFSIVYFGGVIYLFIIFLKRLRGPPQKNLAEITVLSIIIGFAILSCTFDTLKFPNLNWLFHSLLGLMMNLPQNSGKKDGDPS